MKPRIGLIHATISAVPPLVAAFRRLAPHATLQHFVDEGLLPQAERQGLTAPVVGELSRLVERAVASGADGVLLSCSTFSPSVPELQRRFAVPLISIDEAMLRLALGHGPRLGVIATVATAGPTTAGLLHAYAAESGNRVDVTTRIVPEAFAALKAGDAARHDALVREQITALLPGSDAIVLAQISMARALKGAPAYSRPVLASVETSVRAILGRLAP